jgi:hypothetical protein
VFNVLVPASAAIGETYARFRLSEDSLLGPNGDASSGEVEDIRLVVANNPFQNPTLQHDVNGSGDITPLDALQVINAVTRNNNTSIDLSQQPLPARLPPFPDVSGNGIVSNLDALLVINELARLPNSSSGSGETLAAEGEQLATSFVPAVGGVFASDATVVGDVLITQALQSTTRLGEAQDDEVSTIVTETEDKTSVFDHPADIGLDEIVDTLAEDTASSAADDENAALDQLFAQI